MIAVIDYGAGNLGSIRNALDFLRVENIAAKKAADLGGADGIIFPGVGSFGTAMGSLEKRGLKDALKKCLREGKPYLGICLGMQALFEGSEESSGVNGLGIMKGQVVKFKKGKVPQVGWNKVVPVNGLLSEGYAYFLNSYYAVPEDKGIVAAKTDYFGEFASAVRMGNITAVQFHPEKSGLYGIEFLQRWLGCSRKG